MPRHPAECPALCYFCIDLDFDINHWFSYRCSLGKNTIFYKFNTNMCERVFLPCQGKKYNFIML